MKELIISNGSIVLVDDDVYEWASKHSWYPDKDGYACRTIRVSKGKTTAVRLHRLIVGASVGEQVDHEDLNVANCLRTNLRLCTHSDNKRNTPKYKTMNGNSTTSKYKGVSFDRRPHMSHKPWYAYINHDCKMINLGHYASEEEAALVYNQAALSLFGKFSRLNDARLP